MSFEKPWQRGVERRDLVSRSEEIERVRADELNPSSHLYVLENGVGEIILNVVPTGSGEITIFLANGNGERQYEKDEPVKVLPRTYD